MKDTIEIALSIGNRITQEQLDSGSARYADLGRFEQSILPWAGTGNMLLHIDIAGKTSAEIEAVLRAKLEEGIPLLLAEIERTR